MGCATIIQTLFQIEEKKSMTNTKRGITIASMMLLLTMSISACDMRYSTPPAVTPTPASQSLFSSPMPTTMSDVQAFATGTAIAQLTAGASTSGGGDTATSAPGVTPLVVTATATPLAAIKPTS